MMQQFFFGTTSKRRRDTCHIVWRKILDEAIRTSPLDFGIVCGGRGREAQNKAFSDGNSGATWGESDHNYMRGYKFCSLAVDVAPYCSAINDYIWHDANLWVILSNHIIDTARELGYKIEWGGHYANVDKPHFALRF